MKYMSDIGTPRDCAKKWWTFIKREALRTDKLADQLQMAGYMGISAKDLTVELRRRSGKSEKLWKHMDR
jgi:hypothetical protein